MQNEHIAKVGSRGQVVIPANIRRLLGLQSGETVVFRVDDERQVTVAAAVVIARRSRGPVKHYTNAEAAQILMDSAYTPDEIKDARRKVEAMGLDPNAFSHDNPQDLPHAPNSGLP